MRTPGTPAHHPLDACWPPPIWTIIRLGRTLTAGPVRFSIMGRFLLPKSLSRVSPRHPHYDTIHPSFPKALNGQNCDGAKGNWVPTGTVPCPLAGVEPTSLA